MTKKTAVIDCYNQDIGLKILFPEADYYIKFIEFKRKIPSMNNYNIIPKFDFNCITDKNYDYLFIIFPLYNIVPNTPYFNNKDLMFYNEIISIINKNKFKKVFLFDNYDFDYDPNDIVKDTTKIDLFFKRNMNKTKTYQTNVVPFPFIMFGYQSMIELIDRRQVVDENNVKLNRIFFTGTLTPERRHIYDKIANLIYNPGHLNFNDFLHLCIFTPLDIYTFAHLKRRCYNSMFYFPLCAFVKISSAFSNATSSLRRQYPFS